MLTFLSLVICITSFTYAWFITYVNLSNSITISTSDNAAKIEVYNYDLMKQNISFYCSTDDKLNASDTTSENGSLDVEFSSKQSSVELMELYYNEHGIDVFKLPTYFVEIKVLKENFNAYIKGDFTLHSSNVGFSSPSSVTPDKWVYRSLVVSNNSENLLDSAFNNDEYFNQLKNSPSKSLSEGFSLFDASNNGIVDESNTLSENQLLIEPQPEKNTATNKLYFSKSILIAISLNPTYFVQLMKSETGISSKNFIGEMSFSLKFEISNDPFLKNARGGN